MKTSRQTSAFNIFFFLGGGGGSGVLTNPVSSPVMVIGTQMTSHRAILVMKSEILHYIGQPRSYRCTCLLCPQVFRLLLLITVSRLLNWVIYLGDVFVLTWRGCHLQPTGCKQTHSFLMLGGHGCLQLPALPPVSSFKLKERHRQLFFFGGGVCCCSSSSSLPHFFFLPPLGNMFIFVSSIDNTHPAA